MGSTAPWHQGWGYRAARGPVSGRGAWSPEAAAKRCLRSAQFRPLLAGLTGDGISMADIPTTCVLPLGIRAGGAYGGRGQGGVRQVIVAVVGLGLERCARQSRQARLPATRKRRRRRQLVMKPRSAGETCFAHDSGTRRFFSACSGGGEPVYRILLTAPAGPSP
jgi:hypothetical protein